LGFGLAGHRSLLGDSLCPKHEISDTTGLSQDAFSDVSSRTYLSSLERGLKSPTLNKIEDICAVLDVHPLTLLVLAYAGSDLKSVHELMDQIAREVSSFSTPSIK